MNSETPAIVPCEGLKCVKALLGKVQSLSFKDKYNLVTSPKPTPDLNTSQKHFSRSVYSIQWLVGCSHLNNFFCWPCLFFCNEKNNAWTITGYNDLKNLSVATKRHQSSLSHLNAVTTFCSFGKLTRIKTSLSRQLGEEISKYNMRVDHNRAVFQRLVDVVCLLAQQELPFQGNDESKTSLNRGNFLEIVSLLSKYDFVLETYTQQQEDNKPGPSYLSNKFQNDIIHSISEVIKSRIKLEINTTKFVSVIVDGTPDISNSEQLCVILRYHYGNDIHDRFMGYVNLSENRTSETLSKIILDFLNEYECIGKLVAQSYDGASVILSLRNGVQQKIKDVCPQAIYIWCNSHILNLVLSKSCGRISEVSSFFSALQAMISFFSNNTKVAAFYESNCNQQLPHLSEQNQNLIKLFTEIADNKQLEWDGYFATHSCSSRILNTVHEQKQNLIKLFTEIADNTQQEWDGDSILAAENFCSFLTSFNFIFFLSLFHKIFEMTDGLYNTIKKSQVDVGFCVNKTQVFDSWLHNELLAQFSTIYEDATLNTFAPRLRCNVTCIHTEYKRIFLQVIDIISSEIIDRYSEIFKLEFFQLLNNKKFNKYNRKFPETAFYSLLSLYGNHFDRETLEAQLICLYSSPELKDLNISNLIDFLHENSLQDAFHELLKLAHLIVTIPATSCSGERTFSSLKRIHTHLRNTQGQERLSELSTIAIEKQLLVELKRSPTFYADVIKSFVQKDTVFELEYRN